ncbi:MULTISPECIES: aromatic-ring-hydroxylating dioxygenase subunit beta [Variovorax]|uniref:aromatic-ring-hydroxylating dioxygenase subunit beta n=1 Tax=Variovorax atrisoli TaxID=3394203 RepID=UPI001052FEF3|nr:aromatic-ring-hydroxylating dioxygenase subunit beta [Variovorax paradoxus]MDR6520817.1 3-phenylpropionate/cinnamic acid dioxygenase small subunit [Variovorax paradoxus]
MSVAECVDLIYREAFLLDEGRYEDWLKLFAATGRYWVPLSKSQEEGDAQLSIADEDMNLLRLRIERLASGRAHSQQPPSSMQHVLQQPMLIEQSADANEYGFRTAFTYAECRGDEVLTLHGHYVHRLVRAGEQFHIQLKRVNLVNAASRLPMIQLFP